MVLFVVRPSDLGVGLLLVFQHVLLFTNNENLKDGTISNAWNAIFFYFSSRVFAPTQSYWLFCYCFISYYCGLLSFPLAWQSRNVIPRYQRGKFYQTMQLSTITKLVDNNFFYSCQRCTDSLSDVKKRQHASTTWSRLRNCLFYSYKHKNIFFLPLVPKYFFHFALILYIEIAKNPGDEGGLFSYTLSKIDLSPYKKNFF